MATKKLRNIKNVVFVIKQMETHRPGQKVNILSLLSPPLPLLWRTIIPQLDRSANHYTVESDTYINACMQKIQSMIKFIQCTFSSNTTKMQRKGRR